jgi:hypothetical protein
MSEPLYNIVFHGTIQPGKDKKSVIVAMAGMFKTEPAKVLPYFSGDRRVIKPNLNKATVLKYKAALEKIGLVIKIEKAGADAEPNAIPAKTEPTKAGLAKKAKQKPKAGSDNSKPLTAAKAKARAKAEAIGAQISTNGISMAEVGADVIEHPVEVTPKAIGDISDISVSEVGVDLIENPVEVTPQAIGDISDISVADVGADIIENPVEVTPQPIGDISNISMAEVGADVIKNPKPKEVEPLPDISELTLE